MVGRIPKGIDPELLYLTGAIVTWCGRIEGVLVHCLISIRQHEAFKAIARKEKFPIAAQQLIKQWAKGGRLILAQDPKLVAKINHLEKELLDLSLDRNVLVHGFWPYGGEPDGGALQLGIIRPAKGDQLQLGSCEIDVERLDSINERAVALYHQLMPMVFRFTAVAKRP